MKDKDSTLFGCTAQLGFLLYSQEKKQSFFWQEIRNSLSLNPLIKPDPIRKKPFMYYLTYLSSATELFDEKELTHILEKSRKNNSEAGISGILIYIDGNIIQLLEGEEEKVTQLFLKICNDHRHKGVIKMTEGPLSSRNFPDWSMGFKSISVEEAEKLTGYRNIRSLEFSNSPNEQAAHPAMTVLGTFMQHNRI